ncbi:hypothetical protein GCM10010121_062960 [Streptomyces brasiliensis]|uniref:Alpha/beta hydrolase fold-3 domain-containing protein n=1 Tax=Streptomyces brasiliensis TaxID=1954 RepID=A0A917L7D7_9ACTN|nr:hypothetical protein GCM10010121_062960 [Streptomyces brasiliensis]
MAFSPGPDATRMGESMTGFPPMLIQVGTNEILLDDSTRLAARAGAAGVDVILDITADVPHVFQSFAGVLDEADEALDRAALFLGQHIRTRARRARQRGRTGPGLIQAASSTPSHRAIPGVSPATSPGEWTRVRGRPYTRPTSHGRQAASRAVSRRGGPMGPCAIFLLSPARCSCLGSAHARSLCRAEMRGGVPVRLDAPHRVLRPRFPQAGGVKSPPPSAQEQAYYRCLEENGVVLEKRDDGQLRADKDVDQAATESSAQQKCVDLLPDPVPASPAPAEAVAAAQKFSACVRENGFPGYPDPDPKSGQVEWSGSEGKAYKTDEFVAVAEKCSSGAG